MTGNDLIIKILVDNKTNGNLIEEHGFSVWIEAGGRKVLFDTGQGKALVSNAAALGCDLGALDALILSHGHYDHCGAIDAVLEINPELHVYAHSDLLTAHYSIKPGETARNISVPQHEKNVLMGLSENRMHWLDGPQEIFSTIGITGAIERRHPLEDTGGPFYMVPGGRIHDPIMDDMSIWFKVGHGLIIITGCCHSGLINTVDHIRQISGIDRIRGIIGGLHLNNASGERLRSTCSALKEWNPEIVVPCHCTGDDSVSFLINELGGVVVSGSAGLELTFN